MHLFRPIHRLLHQHHRVSAEKESWQALEQLRDRNLRRPGAINIFGSYLTSSKCRMKLRSPRKSGSVKSVEGLSGLRWDSAGLPISRSCQNYA